LSTDRKSFRSEITIAGSRTPGAGREGVTIVVPCFNEGTVIPHLRVKLDAVRQRLWQKYEIYLIIADDGSTDNTWRMMQASFGNDPSCTLVRQPTNLGVAATILSGIRTAKTEIVCSIDCDCTYDPNELGRLVPRLTSGVDLVTGSPYHPLGRVRNVPGWRLVLSKTASILYRCVLRHKLYTYTSCFRVYRRSAILKLNLRYGGFLGIAELIAKLDFQDAMIVECPTDLWARVQGTSKMKIAKVLVGHLYFLSQLLVLRGRRTFFDSRSTESESSQSGKKRGTLTPWVRS
jgi:glycosyltransferase involved in cell wall biosynthesis